MTRRLVLALLMVALVGAGCSSADDGGDSGSATGSSDDSSDASDAGADDAAPTSSTSSTTEPPPAEAIVIPDLRIDLVEFGDAGFVRITNTGTDDADLNGIFLCQFPTYIDLGTVVSDGIVPAGGSVEIEAGVVGGLISDGGEAALYSGNDFTNADAVFAYVQWGTGGGRAGVAAEAGIWPDATATVTPDPAFTNIELFGDPADPDSWG